MYSDWKITWREALFSVIIIAILYGFGVWISNPLLTKATEKSQKVITAIKVSDNHKFDHIRRTNAGYFLADGNLIANDTIRMEELPGKYSRVKKVKEEYRTHVETYTTTDGKGHTTTHTRVYHSWDAVKHENFETKSYTFLGQRFTKKEINYSCSTTKDTTIYNKKFWGSDVRYVYYTTPVTVFGVMEGTAADKAYKDLNFRKGTTTKELVERAEKHNHDAPIGFWVLWWVMTAAIVFLFVYCENEWLEDKKNNVPM